MPRWICRGCAAALSAVVLVGATSCSPQEPPPDPGVSDPPEAAMATVLAETIDEVRPPQVTFRSSMEQPADADAHRFNTQYWDFVAADEASLVAAANDFRDAAVADGWTVLSDFVDPTGAGVFVAHLSKGAMLLDLRYATAASFVLDPDDEDVLRLTAEITYDPSAEPGFDPDAEG